jgi:citrate lyase beta subunit
MRLKRPIAALPGAVVLVVHAAGVLAADTVTPAAARPRNTRREMRCAMAHRFLSRTGSGRSGRHSIECRGGREGLR